MKHRIASTSVILLLCCLFSIHTSTSRDQADITLTVNVKDNYIDVPLKGADVTVLRNGNILDTEQTDAHGVAQLSFTTTRVESHPGLPASFEVTENYPNPFSDHTSVGISVPDAQPVRAAVYNVLGQRVAQTEFYLDPGYHTMGVTLRHLPSGMYFLNVYGDEPRTIKLMKMGGAESIEGAFFSVQPGGSGLIMSGIAVMDEQITVRVEKDRYARHEHDVMVASDTTIHVELSRNNEVAIIAADRDDKIVPKEMQVTGEFFNVSIISPDTLIMNSGLYSITAPHDSTTGFEEVVEIPSVDTTLILQVEYIREIIGDQPTVHFSDHADDELLFQLTLEGGINSYYHGTDNPDSLAAYYITQEDTDGRKTVLFLSEEYYPLKWMHEEFIVSVRRDNEDEFNPEKAFHFLIDNETSDEDTVTVNIQPDDLYYIVDRIENLTDRDLSHVYDFLEEFSDDFDEIQQNALTKHSEQYRYIIAAAGFSAATAAVRLLDAVENNANLSQRSGSDEMSVQAIAFFGWPELLELAAGLLQNIIVHHFFDLSGEGAPLVDVFFCRGASKVPYICHFIWFVDTGVVSNCVDFCQTSLSCFTDICDPQQISRDLVIQYRNSF